MYYNTNQATPYAYITQGKHRLKQYGQNVYMKNGSEFELELFNPKQLTILAKIKINGSYIGGGGIVLRPGERVFLERYLDDAKKFLFETYNVDGESSEVMNAIRNNGEITVEFYDEYVKPQVNIRTPFPQNAYWYSTYNTNIVGISNPSFTTTCYNPTITTSGSIGNNSCNSLSFNSNTKSIETGRVEKGSNSEQSFTSVDKDFNSYTTSISTWKILPESVKPYESKDIKVYCTNCGTKRKKDSFKFCPNCGEKF